MLTQFCAKQLSSKIGNKLICRDLSFHMVASEVWGIIGPNGCGKSTLLHTLCGIHGYVAGEILLDQKNLQQLSRKSIAQNMAILFQDFEFSFSQTVFEYCLSARYPHRNYFQHNRALDIEIVEDALQQVQLEHVRDFPLNQLSGGERRRASIASVISQTPRIFLLDEPTNHLDLHHQMRICQYFRKQNQCIVIMSLHDVNIAQHFCDQLILVFGNGDVLIGKPDHVLTPDTLTHLYQHPIVKINNGASIYWHAKM